MLNNDDEGKTMNDQQQEPEPSLDAIATQEVLLALREELATMENRARLLRYAIAGFESLLAFPHPERAPVPAVDPSRSTPDAVAATAAQPEGPANG
jgi:hypothetical protein